MAQWHQDCIDRRPQRFEYTLQDNVLELLDLRQGARHFIQKLVGVKKDICLAAGRVVTRDRLLEEIGERSSREAVVKALEELIEDNVILAMGQELLFLAVDSQAMVPLDLNPEVLVPTNHCQGIYEGCVNNGRTKGCSIGLSTYGMG